MKKINKGEAAHQDTAAVYRRPSCIKTVQQIMSMSSKQQTWLVENFIPSGQLTGLVAPSDVGKSIFCRQLAVSTLLCKEYFLGQKLQSDGRQVIYVSTEDMDYDWREKMLRYPLTEEERACISDKLLLITNFGENSHELLTLLEEEIRNNPTALIVYDVFSDIFSSDINNAVAVRSFLKPYKQLAASNNTAMLFVHHVTKKGEMSASHGKQHVLGSQAIEASMRSVLELRKDPSNPEERILKVTKGNYVSEQIKKQSYRLKLNDDLVYEPCSKSVGYLTEIDLFGKVMTLHYAGHTLRGIVTLLEAEGIKIGKTKVGEIIKQSIDPRISADSLSTVQD